ncbi:DUF551 domain-containing protein [Escherichia coli]|nr:DUF551 domain-containing protein [Escherichia coli]MCN7925899.1 DUF551 domain-containing protein [Escherichia coli]
MITITKERLQWLANISGRDDIDDIDGGEIRELALIALASLEAEPVAECIVEDGGMCIDGFGEYVGHSLHDGTHQLYTAPPALVVPDEMDLLTCHLDGVTETYADGWNACRAAMLHGAEPVNQTYKSPHTQFEQVADLYEMQFADGSTCTFHTDAQRAAQWLQVFDGNRVQEYVKLERLQNALSGNSPVTTDGWISCSERMPAQDDWILIYSKHGEYMAGQVQGEYMELSDGTLSWLGNALFWIPLPEPPQEVK